MLLSHYVRPDNHQRGFYPGGASGVVYFLILSGFVLCAAYSAKLQTNNFTYKDYISKRLIRVVPLNWLALAMSVALAFGVVEIEKLSVALNIFSVQAWCPDSRYCYGMNVPSWALGPILLFYFLFPLFYRLLKKTPKKFVAIFTTLLTALLIFYALLPDHYEPTTWIVRVFPPFRLVEFIFGMLTYEAYILIKNSKLGERIAALRFSVKSIIEIATIALWFLFLWIYYRLDNRWLSSVVWWIPTLVMILTLALLDSRGGIVTRLLHLRPLVYLGEVSFCIYLTHTITFSFLGRVYHHFNYYPTMPLAMVFTIICCIIMGILIYEFFDKPLTKYLRRKLQSKSKKADHVS